MKARLFTLFAALCLLSVPVLAQTAAELRSRMAQRLPAVDALKAKEAIGENNRGFVEARGNGAAEAAAVVSDENRDREAVYTIIARETGASADSVGKARARHIAENSRTGVWVQDERGAWRRK